MTHLAHLVAKYVRVNPSPFGMLNQRETVGAHLSPPRGELFNRTASQSLGPRQELPGPILVTTRYSQPDGNQPSG
jgi:hypothetical protein